nr:MAG TPA: hypothetical protein [Caudoviricetes sp.]
MPIFSHKKRAFHRLYKCLRKLLKVPHSCRNGGGG